MEKDNWIKNVVNSTNGIKQILPGDDLFSKIQQRIQSEAKVSSKTLWLVAASIAVILILNITIISSKSKVKEDSSTAFLEMTVNQSNQLYK